MKKIIFIFLLICSSAVNAATYFISPSGSDASGTGSAAAPWKTLSKALSVATAAGDIIRMTAGTYTETGQLNLARAVSIQGDGYATTIIKSSASGQWSTFLTLQSPQDTNGDQSISGVTLDGQYVSESNNKTWIGIWITGRSNVLIHDCKIINFRDRGVIFKGQDQTDPVLDPGHHATGNKFYNNIVLNSAAGTGNYGGGLINVGAQLGMEIYGNTLIQDQRVNFKNGWPVKYWDNGWNRGLKIYNNILIKAPYKGTYPGQNGDWDFAVELFNNQGLEIYNNTVQGSLDINYNIKGSYEHSAWIHHNTITHSTLNANFESGIILEFRTEHILIENNTINNASSGVQFNTRTKSQNGGYPNPGGGTPAGGFSQLLNNVIRNNLFTNIYQGNGTGTAAGITVISESGNDPQISGLEISHNTIIAKSGDAPYIGIDLTSMENGTGTGININDNIVVGFNDSWLRGSSPRPGISSLNAKSNVIWSNGNGNAANWPGGSPASYTYSNNVAADPLLDAAYKPKPGSPAIGKATDGSNIGYNGGGSSPGNIIPVAFAGDDQEITLPANTVTLQGAGMDQDGSVVAYQWKLGTTVIGNTNPMVLANLVAGEYDVSLTVTDNLGAVSAPDVMHITVKPAAPPPPTKFLVIVITIYNPDGSVSKTIKIYSDGSSTQ